MSAKLTLGKFQFDLSPSAVGFRPRDPEQPFRVVILADLSGRASRGVVAPLMGRSLRRLDVDTADGELARLGAVIRLTDPVWPGGALELSVDSLEAFHPDALLRRPMFSEWLALRRQLGVAATAASAAAEVRNRLGQSTAASGVPVSAPGSAPGSAAAAGPAGVESTDDTLARLLGRGSAGGGSPAPSSPAPSAPSSAASAVDALIRGVLGAAAVPGRTTEQEVGQQTVDGELSRLLGAVLHHPAWQEVEAAWRGVDLLVREFGGEETIQLRVLDVSLAELEADLLAQEDLAASGLFRLLREASPAMIVSAFRVEARSGADLEWIGRLACVGRALRATVFAGVHERLIGCPSVATHPDPDDWRTPAAPDVPEAWGLLRRREEARGLGLALPRLLMRLPYGRGHDEVETISYEEFGAGRAHERYLWGSAAFACAHAVLDAFRAEGWDMNIAGAAEVGDRPVHRYMEHGATTVMPCAEAWLSDRAAERIQEAGLIAIQSVKGRDAVRLALLRSISSEDGSFE